MFVFTEAVEKKVSDTHGRLVRLLKFTEEEAKETINYCIQKPPKRGYERAKILLEQHHGNPHRILATFCREIKV